MLDPFYPVVPDVSWVKRLVPIGTRLIQLRIKDQPADEIGRQVAEARDICVLHGAQLIVNDYWQTAIDEGCALDPSRPGGPLDADIKALRRAGIKIGVSTHDHAELDKGLAVDPDYVALGPIWPTLLKQMPWAPQGTERLAEWKRLVGKRPLVAIGGLTLERALLVPEVRRRHRRRGRRRRQPSRSRGPGEGTGSPPRGGSHERSLCAADGASRGRRGRTGQARRGFRPGGRRRRPGLPGAAVSRGAGVGRLTIVDHDTVEETNLHRQPLYAMADIGKPKAETAAAVLQALQSGDRGDARRRAPDAAECRDPRSLAPIW